MKSLQLSRRWGKAPLRRALMLSAGIAALASSVCISAASAGTGKPAKPDFAFYAGKTVTYIIPQSVGGTFSYSMVPASVLAGQYLHATINDVYVPAGSGIVGDDEIAAAPNDGLTIGDETLGTVISNILGTGNGNISFSMQKISYIAGVPQNPIAIVSCTNSSLAGQKLSQIIKSKSVFNIIATSPGTAYNYQKILFTLYGTPAHDISGFSSTAAATAACLGGDAPLAVQSVASLTPADFAQGLVHALVVGIPIAKTSAFYPYFKNTPDLATFFKENKSKLPAAKVVEETMVAEFGTTATTQWVAGPPGIAVGKLNAMRAAWKYALSRPSVIANEVANSVGYGWRSYTGALPYIRISLKHQAVMNRFINEPVSSIIAG